MIDLHSHLMPEVDDGARSLDEALEGVARFREAGVTSLATTPHLDGSLTLQPEAIEARLAELDAAWSRLVSALGNGGPRVARGTEVKLDTPSPELGDDRVRLAGTAFVLVEFPFMGIPPRSADVLAGIRSRGYIPLVAHPERYEDAWSSLDTLMAWREAGAYLQVNCGSLLGRYGEPAGRVAWRLMELGAVDLLASDNHSRGPVQNPECMALLEEMGAGEQADLLLRTNPGRILDDELPMPVAPLPSRDGFWRRLARMFE
jgi:protein-tyrosine phosphatase